MELCSELGDVSEFHAAAHFALASCPPCAPAGLSELCIFTDASASPPARPDASARLGWSAVCVGHCGTGYHFLGALFHGMTGSGDVVQHDPVADSNTVELAAVLWALVWVVISCPPCGVCIATDSLFSCNITEAIWSVGWHEQLARLCSSMLLIARQVTDVRFEHVKAHEGNLSMNLLIVSPRELREVLLPRSLLMSLVCWLVVTVWLGSGCMVCLQRRVVPNPFA